MIPSCKHYTFTATRRDNNERVTGCVLAPTKYLALLNIRLGPAAWTLYDVKIGGVKKKLSEDQKKSGFFFFPS